MQQCSSESRWQAVGIVALVLLVGCLLPSPLGRRPEFDRFGPDKLLHFLGHGYLTVTIADALSPDGPGPVAGVLAVGGSTAFSLVLGSLQQYVPGRAPERADVVAGLLGSILCLVARRVTPRQTPLCRCRQCDGDTRNRHAG